MSKKPSQSETIGVREAAAELKVSEQTVRNYVARGKVTAARNPINNYREISRADVASLKQR